MRPPLLAFVFVSVALVSAPSLCLAWPPDGRAVCTEADSQERPSITTDGFDGALIAWADRRDFASYDIYVQRVLANGVVHPSWPAGGRALATGAGEEQYPQIVSDLNGGGVVVWRSDGTALYAQHVLSSGIVDPAWPPGGRLIATSSVQDNPTISDGQGGAIVTWSAGSSIFAHHVLANGSVDPAWPANGLTVCSAANGRYHPTLDTDGAGGAIIAWYDQRTGNSSSNDDIYAQHVLASGSVDATWPVNGRVLCLGLDQQVSQVVTRDGAGGAVVAWMDYRGGISNQYDIYAQHVLASGVVDPAWPVNGRAVCALAKDQRYPKLVSDGSGNVIVAWMDERGSDGGGDIYAQRLASNGAPLWTLNGIAVCSALKSQFNPELVGDGAGGAIVTWWDDRARDASSANSDIYAQRVLPGGTVDPAWPVDGRALCTAASIQDQPAIVARANGAIVAWRDTRNFSDADIYAQAVSIGGILGVGEKESPQAFGLSAPAPNPAWGRATFHFIQGRDAHVTLSVIGVDGRSIRSLVDDERAAGEYSVPWNLRDDAGRPVPPAVYFVELVAGGQRFTRRTVVVR